MEEGRKEGRKERRKEIEKREKRTIGAQAHVACSRYVWVGQMRDESGTESLCGTEHWAVVKASLVKSIL